MNDRLRQIFPKGSRSFFEANSDGLPSCAKSESSVLNRPDGKVDGKTPHPSRYALSITSYRVRLIDPDNLCPKFFIDSLRYAGVLHDDRQIDLDYSIRQKKVEKTSEEKTLIEIQVI